MVTGLQGMEATGLSAFLLGSVGSAPIMPLVRYCMISISRQGSSQVFRRLLSVLSFSDVVLKISVNPHDDLEIQCWVAFPEKDLGRLKSTRPPRLLH